MYIVLLALLSTAVWAADQPLHHALEQENRALRSTLRQLDGWSYGLSSRQANTILADLSHDAYYPYQDIVVNGETLWSGTGPDCPSRYQAISRSLNVFKSHPMNVLDVGAANGYFAINLCRDRNASIVMVDTTDRLKKICKYNTDSNKRALYIQQLINAQDMQQWSPDATFDASLLLNVLHHMPDWKEFIEQVRSRSKKVIVENPPANDPRASYKPNIPAIDDYCKTHNAEVIARTTRTIPGYYNNDNLPVMRYGMQVEVPLLENVKSTMYVLDGTATKPSTQLRKKMFGQSNITFAGASFDEASI